MLKNLLKKTALSILFSAFIILWSWSFLSSWSFFGIFKSTKKIQPKEKPVPEVRVVVKPKYVRGIHLSAWAAGSKKLRGKADKLLEATELNSVVIAVKEYEGEVYIPFKGQTEYKTFTNAIPDLDQYMKHLREKGIYTIARIVVFKDNSIIKVKPEWAVKTKSGKIWKDDAGNSWVDPYNKEVWDYNLNIADRAVELGFDEIQFDYTRFPSDGNMKDCVYCVKTSSQAPSVAVAAFLREAASRLKPKGVNVSVDVFGLTTTSTDDMGIGQKIVEMAREVDFVSPMVYPSHYAEGEYGIPDPDKDPYKTVYTSLNSAVKRVPKEKLRPYLQDFSIQHHYGDKEVRAQIQACYDNDIGSWLLWNPRCEYTGKALKAKKFQDSYEKSPEEIKKEKFQTKISTATQASAFPSGK